MLLRKLTVFHLFLGCLFAEQYAAQANPSSCLNPAQFPLASITIKDYSVPELIKNGLKISRPLLASAIQYQINCAYTSLIGKKLEDIVFSEKIQVAETGKNRYLVSLPIEKLNLNIYSRPALSPIYDGWRWLQGKAFSPNCDSDPTFIQEGEMDKVNPYVNYQISLESSKERKPPTIAFEVELAAGKTNMSIVPGSFNFENINYAFKQQSQYTTVASTLERIGTVTSFIHEKLPDFLKKSLEFSISKIPFKKTLESFSEKQLNQILQAPTPFNLDTIMSGDARLQAIVSSPYILQRTANIQRTLEEIPALLDTNSTAIKYQGHSALQKQLLYWVPFYRGYRLDQAIQKTERLSEELLTMQKSFSSPQINTALKTVLDRIKSQKTFLNQLEAKTIPNKLNSALQKLENLELKIEDRLNQLDSVSKKSVLNYQIHNLVQDIGSNQKKLSFFLSSAQSPGIPPISIPEMNKSNKNLGDSKMLIEVHLAGLNKLLKDFHEAGGFNLEDINPLGFLMKKEDAYSKKKGLLSYRRWIGNTPFSLKTAPVISVEKATSNKTSETSKYCINAIELNPPNSRIQQTLTPRVLPKTCFTFEVKNCKEHQPNSSPCIPSLQPKIEFADSKTSLSSSQTQLRDLLLKSISAIVNAQISKTIQSQLEYEYGSFLAPKKIKHENNSLLIYYDDTENVEAFISPTSFAPSKSATSAPLPGSSTTGQLDKSRIKALEKLLQSSKNKAKSRANQLLRWSQ